LLNGLLTDIKTPEKPNSNGIKSRLRSVLDKKITHVVLNISEDTPENEIERGFKRFKGEKHSVTLKVLSIYRGTLSCSEV